MGEPAGNRCLVAGALEVRRDAFIAAPAGEIGAAVEYAVFAIDRFGIGCGAGIGARRMAGDEIVDCKSILDGADAVFEASVLLGHD